MKRFITIGAFVAALFVLTTLSACSSEPKTDDHLITFTSDGNIEMPQKLCDQEEPNVSPEMMKKLKQWWDDLGTDKNPNGKVVCTK